jgi:transposase
MRLLKSERIRAENRLPECAPTKTNIAPLRGWCRRGKRLRDHVPHGHWKTQTFLAALRHDQVTAPCLLEGPINAQSFLTYVEQFLLPTLKCGDIVVMDNLSSHKGKSVRDAMRSVGAHRLFLPAYSPDVNPIEQLFSKLKTLLRKARARTFDAVSDSIGDTLNAFNSTECANYLKNAGYTSIQNEHALGRSRKSRHSASQMEGAVETPLTFRTKQGR